MEEFCKRSLDFITIIPLYVPNVFNEVIFNKDVKERLLDSGDN